MGRWGWTIGIAALALTLAFSCHRSASNQESVTHLNHLPEASYTGIESCRNCHFDKYSTFIECEMGRSLRPALLENSSAKWDNVKPVHDTLSGYYYLPFAKGSSLFLMEYRLSGKDTTYRQVQQISYIIGSGQHTNSHLIVENGYLTQAPLTWYSQKGKWDLPPGFENGNNSRWFRTIGIECMTCHNAMPGFVEGSGNQYTEIPHGIDCERCHGPGSLHVDRMTSGTYAGIPPGGYDSTIVHPGKLSPKLQFDICQRCHLQGVAVPEPGKSFMDFRPGMQLNKFMQVFIPRYNDGSFIMASHPDRLTQSACYISSANGGKFQPITCVTCHNPHISVRNAGRSVFNAPCIACHEQQGAGNCTEDLNSRNSAGYDCASCHMPVTGSSDIPHVRVHDHKIQVPGPPQVDVTKERHFIELVCLTSPNPDPVTKAAGYVAYYEQFNPIPQVLDSASRYLACEGAEDSPGFLDLQVRFWFLRGMHEQLVTLGEGTDTLDIGNAWTAYRIGEACLQAGDKDLALRWLLRAFHLWPAYIDFANKLASTYILQGKIQEAWGILFQVQAAFSKDPSVLNNLGFIKIQEKQYQEAEKWLQAALSWDPDHPRALANLASIYMNTGKMYLARQIAYSLHHRFPSDPEFAKLWDACR